MLQSVAHIHASLFPGVFQTQVSELLLLLLLARRRCRLGPGLWCAAPVRHLHSSGGARAVYGLVEPRRRLSHALSDLVASFH